jgi:uncharacterized protein YqjF (DUF2071 family)
MAERPFLTARWTDLVLLNFVVPAELIGRMAPPGTEPDLHDGVAYISIVGFRFQNARVLGVPIPRHTQFDEINLRYYVKRVVDGEVHRGVVFAREVVPRLAVALVANRFYHEKYVTRLMQSLVSMRGAQLAPGDTLEYAWQSASGGVGWPQRGQLQERWNRIGATVASALAVPAADSLEHFMVEHYWGYSHGRDGRTREYRVEHPEWRVAQADHVIWECDVPGTYAGDFAEFLTVPANAFVAEGSAIQLFRGRSL